MCRDIAPVKLYYGLRDYGTAQWDGGDDSCDHIAQRVNLNVGFNERWGNSAGDKKQEQGRAEQYRNECGKCGAVRIDAQIGLEPTLAAYIAAMVEVFREVRRVLRDDGVCWLNIGDSYAGGAGGRGDSGRQFHTNGDGGPASAKHDGVRIKRDDAGLKAKDLMMVPARLAIALQDDGWWLRSDIIWFKSNPMPESVTDRPTSAHEHIFLLTKSARYFYDADAVREPNSPDSLKEHSRGYQRKPTEGDLHARDDGRSHKNPKNSDDYQHGVGGRNLRNVWEIATQPFPGSHFATFPLELPRRCIKAGTSEKGCCSACGAPWVRVVDIGEADKETTRGRQAWTAVTGQRDSAGGLPFRPRSTVDWQPGCTCDADVIPCTVLDPFLGSGTTLLVADQLGRNGIGIELNPAYAQMAKQRITGDAPMFAEVEIDAA